MITKVSVIVPNYNHAKYLPQRLNSIFNQTFQDFEVILLDDCSTDNSVEVLTKYSKHPKVSHFVINKKNSGSPFKQWKLGVSLAKSPYIWIAESDDWAEKNFLETVLSPLCEDLSIGISYCQSNLINKDGLFIRSNLEWTQDLHKQRWTKSFRSSGREECANFLYRKNTIPNASAVVFRKSLASDFPVNFKMAGDWLFWTDILMKGDICFNYQPLNNFRTLESSTRNHNSVAKLKTRIVEGQKVLDRISEVYRHRKNMNEKLKKICVSIYDF